MPALTALAVVLPIDLAIVALLRERPISRPVIILFLGVVTVQAWLITNLASGLGDSAPASVANSFDALITAPHVSRLVFLIAGVFTALAFAARRGTFEGSLLWVLAATAVALLAWRGPHAATLAFTAAQLVLLLGLVEDSYRLAYHDELTGLPGRRALDEALRALDGDFTIAMVDVDHFKRFNDRYGHAAGDQALRMIAIELQQVGGGGRAFRYGGEEFAILFPGTIASDSREHLEKVRASIGARKFALRAPDRPRKKPETVRKKSRPPRTIKVSVSVGAAGPNSRRPSSSEVLRAADRALYRAKGAGRNKVVLAGDKLTKRRA
jgi:diguanylate cyclase (GGDEF)-like protein